MMDWFIPALRVLSDKAVQIKKKKIKLSVVVRQLVPPQDIQYTILP